ncbi:hypothetical protein O2K51_09815 [Apibacter raozihei]|uniref:hypothetical protein n=1 Tax=Apibacter raozihei TaxID=2500547 RepID=UPI000FE2C54E|nr:hypothetical protein [Apibacter raozihei]
MPETAINPTIFTIYNVNSQETGSNLFSIGLYSSKYKNGSWALSKLDDNEFHIKYEKGKSNLLLNNYYNTKNALEHENDHINRANMLFSKSKKVILSGEYSSCGGLSRYKSEGEIRALKV